MASAVPHLDAHIHLWKRSDGERFWMRDKIAALDRDFTEDDLRAQRARCGVGGAIVVQALHSIEESERLLAMAAASDQIAAVVAWVDLFDPMLEARIAHYRRSPHFAGVRPLPPDTFGGDWLSDPRALPALRKLRELDVSVDILQPSQNLRRTAALLREVPGLRAVLNHGGRPAVMTGMLEPWASHVRELAREPSLLVKCSGLVERAGVEWTAATVQPYVSTLIEAFGPRRVMFATNWPVSTISAHYAVWVDALVEVLDRLGLPSADRDAIMHGTAARHYRVTWPAPAR